MSLFKKQTEQELTAMEKTANTLGSKIAENRKKKNLTQEEFAEMLGVSAQAVSKWENDVSCPDIMLLPKIANIFSISIDELMGVASNRETAEEKTDETVEEPVFTDAELKKLKLRVNILPANSQKPIKISVPVSFVLKAASLGIKISAVMGNAALNNVPMDKITELVKSGVTGEIFDMTADDGTHINIEIS